MQDKVFLRELKKEQIKKLKQRQEDKILEKENADFLIKLIQNAESKEDVLKLSALGMSLKRTGFHFDVQLEKSDRTIKYFVKNEKLSFEPLSEAESTKESDSKILDEKCGLQEKAQMDKAEAVEMRKQGEAEVSLVNATLEQKITHTLIIGDNYPALLNLLINYKRKVKVIYIDPPYGKDDLGEFAHTNYDNAITRDNLLSMLYPRLQLAKQLLCDDGVIFCSIDDRNQAYVKGLFDEIFGEGNFVGDFIRKTKSTTNDAKTGLNYQHEFLLCYAKDRANINLLGGEKDLSGYKNPDNDPNGRWVSDNPSAKSGDMKTGYFAVKNPYTGKEDYPPKGMFWRFSQNTIQKHIDEGRICFKKEHKDNERGFIYKRYLKDLQTEQRTFDSLKFVDNAYMNQVATKEAKDIGFVENFAYPKPIHFIKEILRHATTNPSDYVDLQADSMDCHEFANAKSHNAKGAYTNATTTGGGKLAA